MTRGLTEMPLFIFGISMVAVVCVGCSGETKPDVIPAPDRCTSVPSLFTYPLLPLPEMVSVAGFAMDEVNIYLTDNGSWGSLGYNNDGRIMKMAVDGGGLVTLATGEIFPRHIVVDGVNIYWTTEIAVKKMPIAGGVPMTIASDSGAPQGITVDTQHVYWTTNTSRLMRASTDGSDVTELINGSATSFAFTGLALDESQIYWASRGIIDSNDGSVMKMPIQGGPVTTLATGQSDPSRIVVDVNNVYWTNVGDFNKNVGLMKIPINGGTPTTLVSTQTATFGRYAAVAGVFVDAKNVYWTARGTAKYDDYDGTVMSMPIDGGVPTTLASAMLGVTEDITVRRCSVYFAAGGNLHRITQPQKN